MRFRFSIQEVLCVSSCALFIAGQPVVGSVFLGLGCLGAVFRTAMEMQAKQEAEKKEQQTYENVSSLGSQIGSILAEFADAVEEKTPN